MKYITVNAENINHFVENIGVYVNGDNPPVYIKVWYDEKTGQVTREDLGCAYLSYLKQESMLPILKLKINTFLAQDCLFTEGKTLKLIDVIKMVAHIKGGIHSGEPKTEEEHHLLELDKVIEVAGLDASLMILVGLCNIVTNGLRPLYEAIISENT